MGYYIIKLNPNYLAGVPLYCITLYFITLYILLHCMKFISLNKYIFDEVNLQIDRDVVHIKLRFGLRGFME